MVSTSPSHIVATLPSPALPPKTYLLTVVRAHRGDGDDDDAGKFGVFNLTIGSAGPQGPPGLPGPPGATGPAGPTGPAGSLPNPNNVVAVATVEGNSDPSGDLMPGFATTALVSGNLSTQIQYIARTFNANGALETQAFNLLIMTP